MTCSYCGTPGTQFISVLTNGEPKQICKPCIKAGRATPEKSKPHVSAAIPCSADHYGTPERFSYSEMTKQRDASMSVREKLDRQAALNARLRNG